MKRPPLVVVFVALVVIALGETAGAAMSQLRPQIARYAEARVAANPQAHGLAGSAEYDAEVSARAVYAAEAGLSFFHTHAMGLGALVILLSTVAASLVHGALPRAAASTCCSEWARCSRWGIWPMRWPRSRGGVMPASRWSSAMS